MFEGLLLSRDDTVIRLFRRIYQELEMNLEVCTGADQAKEHLSGKKFNAVIVDCDDVHCGPEVLKTVRLSPANKKATAFAILNGVTSMRNAFDLGANLTLQKPISLEHVRKSLRALKAFIDQEHRRYYRVPVDIPVTAIFDEKAEFQIVATNISEGGMALRFGNPIPDHRAVSLRFALPESGNRIEAKVTIAWSDAHGAAGVRFEYLTSTARQSLSAWLLRHVEAAKKLATGTNSQPVSSKSLP